MKSLCILQVLLVIVMVPVFGQNPNWGWAPPITVTSSGSSITCTVTDPTNNQTKTTTKSSVVSYIVSEGVVAWSTTSSSYAMVYDYNAHDWKWESWYGPDNLMLNDGVVTMQSGSQTYAAIYDPSVRRWEWESWYATGSVINKGGIVAFQSNSQTYAATYEASSKNWKWESWYAVEGMLVNDGIVAFQSNSQTYAAVYDPVSKNWDWESWYAEGAMLTSNGVVAFQSSSKTYAAAYDVASRQWKSDSWYETGSISISDGAVLINDNGNTIKKGYDSSSKSWKDNRGTDLVCKMYTSESTGANPLIVYLRFIAIGASSNSYNCGDGHLITNLYAWKQYNNSNSYNISLTVFNNALNNTCSSSLTVTSNTAVVANIAGDGLAIYPNPTVGTVTLTGIGSTPQGLSIYNSLGQEITKQEVVENELIDMSSLPVGIYYLRVNTPKGVINKKIVKQ